METQEQIRLKMEEMKLVELQNQYSHANLTFYLKLKSLREELNRKTRRQNLLNSQLIALRKCLADQQNEIKSLMAQVVQNDDEKEFKTHNQVQSPNITTKNFRYSPKNIGRSLFLSVSKINQNQVSFSPSVSRTQMRLPISKVNLGAQLTNKNTQKRIGINKIKSSLRLQGISPEKTLKLARSLQQLRQSFFSPNLKAKIQNKSSKNRVNLNPKYEYELKRKKE